MSRPPSDKNSSASKPKIVVAPPPKVSSGSSSSSTSKTSSSSSGSSSSGSSSSQKSSNSSGSSSSQKPSSGSSSSQKPSSGSSSSSSSQKSSSRPSSSTTAPAIKFPTSNPPPKQASSSSSSSSSQKILVRVMSPEGMLRFELFTSQTIRDLMELTAEKCKLSLSVVTLTKSPKTPPLVPTNTLSYYKVQHGDMFYCVLKTSDTPIEAPKDFLPVTSDADPATNPNMVLLDEDCGTDSSGEVVMNLKSGCTHPKAMKCVKCATKDRYLPRKLKCGNHGPNASCSTCVKYTDSLVPVILSQDKKKCRKVFMYPEAQRQYSQFATTYAPLYTMIGLIYGHELYDKTTVGEFIYEPPQIHVKDGVSFDNSPEAAQKREVADTLLRIFGLRCIGWIFSHFIRSYIHVDPKDKTEKEDTHSLTANELIMAGRLQAQFGHRFCTMDFPIPRPVPGENWEQSIQKKAGELVVWGHQTSLQFQRLLRRGTISPTQNNDDKYMVQTTEPVKYNIGVGGGVLLDYDSGNAFPVEYGLVQVPFGPTPIEAKAPPFRYRFLPTTRPGVDPHEWEADARDIVSQKGVPFLEKMNDPNLLLYLVNERSVDAEIVYDIARAIVAQREADASGAGSKAKAEKRDTSGFEMIVYSVLGLG